MMMTPVTLPDGTAAVVHTTCLGWGETNIERYGLPALYRTVLDELSEDATCTAVREHDGGVLLDSLSGGGPGVLAYALALCTAPECRAAAEAFEKEHGPHPAMDFERTWASKQATGDQDDRDMVQEVLSAEIQDVNLHWLAQVDPDAARIFRPGCFTDNLLNLAHPVPGHAAFDVGRALEQYAAAKRDEGRMDRFGALFAGTADYQWDAFLPAGATTEAAR
ncbi:hypothetical protein ACFVGX_22335 [Streptomyces sp. NPDC127113]|uniref:hypothetical protein n=1 Tax=Streptomyces sp. NPDC127113 TaxID=3345365 RepID=UPI0036432BEC